MPTTTLQAAPQNRYVYVYKLPDGAPYYVGKGTGPRMRDHIRNAKKMHQLAKTFVVKVTRGLLAKGQEPIIEKLITNIDDEFALLVEQEFISKYGRRDIGTGILTNCTDGGDAILNMSPETRAKIVANLKVVGGDYHFPKGMTPHNKGMPMSDEQKAKVSAATRGRKASPETIIKMKAWQSANNRRRGVVMSEETKQRISASKKGTVAYWSMGPMSEERKAKMKATMELQSWTCPHCMTQGKNKGTANRWHFSNCKSLGVPA